MIPSDLERRIIEAKQKVSFCRELYLAHNKLKVTFIVLSGGEHILVLVF